jgi:hypothetical protein
MWIIYHLYGVNPGFVDAMVKEMRSSISSMLGINSQRKQNEL